MSLIIAGYIRNLVNCIRQLNENSPTVEVGSSVTTKEEKQV
jgi:hypothetical protein